MMMASDTQTESKDQNNQFATFSRRPIDNKYKPQIFEKNKKRAQNRMMENLQKRRLEIEKKTT